MWLKDGGYGDEDEGEGEGREVKWKGKKVGIWRGIGSHKDRI